jgi:hypothetical protein
MACIDGVYCFVSLPSLVVLSCLLINMRLRYHTTSILQEARYGKTKQYKTRQNKTRSHGGSVTLQAYPVRTFSFHLVLYCFSSYRRHHYRVIAIAITIIFVAIAVVMLLVIVVSLLFSCLAVSSLALSKGM